ncbi:MAG: hypothetical protein ACO3QW_05510 [Burkholderiaceae bacterium]
MWQASWWTRDWQDWLTLPLSFQLLAANVAAALLAIAVAWWWVLPTWQDGQTAQAQSEQLRQQWQQAPARPKLAHMASPSARPQPTDLWAMLPPLLQLAQTAGVTLQQAQSTPPLDGAAELLQVTFLGPAQGWQQFVRGLAALAPGVEVVAMRVDATNPDQANALQWQLQLAWAAPSAASQAAPSPAVGQALTVLFSVPSGATPDGDAAWTYHGWVGVGGQPQRALLAVDGQTQVWRLGQRRADGCVLRRILPERLLWTANGRACRATPRQTQGVKP